MYRILVCDDEKDIVSALKIYLSAEGYETVLCYNGLEALKALEENEIHLVLLDIMMPEMDGLNTLSHIREKYNVPVILLTAKGEELTERFVQGDLARAAEGSGLGLAIAKSLTELQNGKFSITVDGDLFKVEIFLDCIQ